MSPGMPFATRAPIVTITALRFIMPKAPAELWAPPLGAAMAEFDIVTPARASAFLANVAHESNELTRLEENLNYSADGLLKTFKGKFDAARAALYARQPQRIANYVYAGMGGNGDEASGDGWKYRGFGPIQLTLHDNHRDAGVSLALPLEEHPENGKLPMIGSRTAAWYFATHGCNALADAGDFTGCTRKINHALLGLAERVVYHERARRILGVA
jgi:putative chitinase